jgi:hypothetical protein
LIEKRNLKQASTFGNCTGALAITQKQGRKRQKSWTKYIEMKSNRGQSGQIPYSLMLCINTDKNFPTLITPGTHTQKIDENAHISHPTTETSQREGQGESEREGGASKTMLTRSVLRKRVHSPARVCHKTRSNLTRPIAAYKKMMKTNIKYVLHTTSRAVMARKLSQYSATSRPHAHYREKALIQLQTRTQPAQENSMRIRSNVNIFALGTSNNSTIQLHYCLCSHP